jgi:thymidine phosphorylase
MDRKGSPRTVHAQHDQHTLRLRRMGIDTYQEPVIYMRSDCHVCRAEGFEAQTRIRVETSGRSILATLNVVGNDLLAPGEAALSDAAWRLLGAKEGDRGVLSHPPHLESLSRVRAKAYGSRLSAEDLDAIVRDVSAGSYTDVELSSFITACAGDRLDLEEIVGLTRAMIRAGERLEWGRTPVMDKHCVGGLPGNRTTMIVVPIVAGCGLAIPKTSSRAITSPAGTADAMETVAPVCLDLKAMRRVVEREGGCIVWGGAMSLSPADDVLIRVERALDLDSTGQLVASVLSKKVAAGSTHVVIDIPVGPTAKVRTSAAAAVLERQLVQVGRAVDLDVRVIVTDGSQPVGRGIGPALEAGDVISVLEGKLDAPADLRERALLLAERILESADHVPRGKGRSLAESVLVDGRAWEKFQAICEAQGGMRTLPRAPHSRAVSASRSGRVTRIDNRRLARVAKLAGAPKSPAAGLVLHTPLGTAVEPGQPLFTVHAEAPGELEYALTYASTRPEIVVVEEQGR